MRAGYKCIIHRGPARRIGRRNSEVATEDERTCQMGRTFLFGENIYFPYRMRRNKSGIYIIIFIVICALLFTFNPLNYTFVYQHNTSYMIRADTYSYVSEYKAQLLKNMTRLLNDLHIRFCIAHGNLIEHTRGKPIYHDDDLDLRLSSDDMGRWLEYCKNNEKDIHRFNLLFDGRLSDADAQKKNGIQVRLLEFQSEGNKKVFENMDIHCDLVANNVQTDIWIVYDIDYNKLRKISYLGVDTYAPSEEDTDYILTKEYGSNYMTPNKRYMFIPPST